jgi:hypothetical protein
LKDWLLRAIERHYSNELTALAILLKYEQGVKTDDFHRHYPLIQNYSAPLQLILNLVSMTATFLLRSYTVP